MSASFSKRLKKRLTFIFLPFLGQLLIRFLYLTNRKKTFISPKIENTPGIYVFWHGELLMQHYFRNFIHNDGPVAVIISEHGDGELITKVMGYFGVEALRGSSRRNAAKALKNALEFAQKGGNIVITPDGPRGPRHSVADGVVVLSQKLDLPIIAQNVVPSRYWRLKSWDQFIIPKPFGTLKFYASDPFKVTDMELDVAKALVAKRLNEHAF